MTDTSIYHYVYRISNVVTGMHYYGVRSSKILPTLDLGIKYYSSSTDQTFMQEQRTAPENFRYKIVRRFESRYYAMQFEIKLHTKFEVGTNSSFYNRAKSTSSGFGMQGRKFPKGHFEKRSYAQQDPTIYTFFHKDGETYIGTQKDFRTEFNLDQPNVSRLVNKKYKCVDGWFISKEELEKNILSFHHKSGLTFTGTQKEFITKFSLCPSHVSVVVNGKRKSVFGWSL